MFARLDLAPWSAAVHSIARRSTGGRPHEASRVNQSERQGSVPQQASHFPRLRDQLTRRMVCLGEWVGQRRQVERAGTHPRSLPPPRVVSMLSPLALQTLGAPRADEGAPPSRGRRSGELCSSIVAASHPLPGRASTAISTWDEDGSRTAFHARYGANKHPMPQLQCWLLEGHSSLPWPWAWLGASIEGEAPAVSGAKGALDHQRGRAGHLARLPGVAWPWLRVCGGHMKDGPEILSPSPHGGPLS